MSFNKTEFKPIPEKVNFSQEEEQVLKYWQEIDAFKAQLEKTKNNPPYTFYDGPPFATGLPHYGNLLAGTIKDVACRYASQTGHYVERRFGWDCHGLPVEYEIDKKIGIKSKQDVLNMGIDKYNAECRGIVMKYSQEWETIVNRFGRWIDFKNDYKTMDTTFMESIWAVFKRMFDKGLVYRGCRIMPYSNAVTTVLSNFETQQNYQQVDDPSIIVSFPMVDDPNTAFLAWTTTPWTLPSNLALCVHPDFDYVKLKDKDSGMIYIMAECRISEYYGNKKDAYTLVEKVKGKDLKGIKYVPLYDFFVKDYPNAHQILVDTYVTEDAGTGVVHQAPGFGADDFRVCIEHNVVGKDNPPVPLDANGHFTDKIEQFKGQYIKSADKEIKKDLKQRKRLLTDKVLKHSYPLCWRSDTPLIYKAINCWFIGVTQIKDQLLENNKKSYWVPSFAQEKRFNNWLRDAQDWCFSRNRFWGNPIPLWVSEDYEEIVCVGSVAELEELSGVKGIKDLHRENIDHITIPSKKGKGQLRRIEEVFDCWFESGSMPFASQHWPFSTSDEELMKRFPADFIAEGLDQTRGWFYTLNIIATAIKNDTPYKNLVVNGIVQAEDGKKMSKSKKNYPDPMNMVKQYGADAIRLYMINSPLVKAESLNFSEKGVNNTIRDVFLPIYNSYRFLFQNITRFELDTEENFRFDQSLTQDLKNLSNITDAWVIGANQNLIKFFRQEMKHYRLYTVVPKLLKFLDDLTNTYIKLNRSRIKGDEGLKEQRISLTVLYDVLLKTVIMLAPFVPFTSEMFYTNLSKCLKEGSPYLEKSIHLVDIPEFQPHLINENLEVSVQRMNSIITLARNLRLKTKNKLNNKQPIKSLTIINESQQWLDDLKPLLGYIENEINADTIKFETNFLQYVERKATALHKELNVHYQEKGKKYSQGIVKALNALTVAEVEKLEKEGFVEVEEKDKKGNFVEKHRIELKFFELGYNYKADNLGENIVLGGESDFSLLIDSNQTHDLKVKGAAREFVSAVQKLRKTSGVQIEDRILVFYEVLNGSSELIGEAFNQQMQLIQNSIKKPVLPVAQMQDHLIKISNGTQEYDIDGLKFRVVLCQESIKLDIPAIQAVAGEQSKLVQQVLLMRDVSKLQSEVQNNGGKLDVVITGNTYVLNENKEFFFNWK